MLKILKYFSLINRKYLFSYINYQLKLPIKLQPCHLVIVMFLFLYYCVIFFFLFFFLLYLWKVSHLGYRVRCTYIEGTVLDSLCLWRTHPFKNVLSISFSMLNTVWWTYLVRACFYLACYSTPGDFEAKSTIKRKGEDTALIEFVSYLMKAEWPHEWKQVPSVLNFSGVSSRLLTWVLALNGKRWRGRSTWDLQTGTFSALWGQVTSCWNPSGHHGYIHTRVQGYCLWVQQCKTAKGTRTSSSRALAEGRPHAE